MRSTGQSAEINKKKMRLWTDVMKNINSIDGNNRDVNEVKKNGITSKVPQKPVWMECSRREARMTGGPNEASKVKDEDILTLSWDKEASTSEWTMGRWVMGHGSDGSRKSMGHMGHGSRLRDP